MIIHKFFFLHYGQAIKQKQHNPHSTVRILQHVPSNFFNIRLVVLLSQVKQMSLEPLC